MSVVLPTTQNIEQAAQELKEGGLVAFPTETVYGLGCDTFNSSAINQVYTLKGRPKNNPTIAHILESSWALQLTEHWNEQCDQLAKAFWPGPLTIVLPKKEEVPKAATGGRNTIAIRSPNHPVAKQLLSCFGSPISAPSANKSGYISPTTAKHVEDEFGDNIQILDGGACEEGIESTVLSLISEPTILRPGTISGGEISEIIGKVFTANLSEQNDSTDSPGTTAHHYSPHTSVTLLTAKEIDEIADENCVAITIYGAPKNAKAWIQMPVDPKEYATRLYGALREADAVGTKRIVIEKPKSPHNWFAVLDRLNRCAAKH
jgi:L-threonylcarbamoyladenylate synthase